MCQQVAIFIENPAVGASVALLSNAMRSIRPTFVPDSPSGKPSDLLLTDAGCESGLEHMFTDVAEGHAEATRGPTSNAFAGAHAAYVGAGHLSGT